MYNKKARDSAVAYHTTPDGRQPSRGTANETQVATFSYPALLRGETAAPATTGAVMIASETASAASDHIKHLHALELTRDPPNTNPPGRWGGMAVLLPRRSY